MTSLLLACALFLGIHLLVSGTPLRGVIVRAIGEKPYLGAFSLTSLGALVWIALAYRDAPYLELWVAGPGLQHPSLLLMLLATVLVVTGLATPNPTATGAERLLAGEWQATGIIKVTRHPFLWGVAIWALAHLLANGDVASVLLFGSFLALALIGPHLIDAKLARRDPAAWQRLAAQTSWLPFAALAQGRARVSLAEIGWRRLGLAILVYAGLLLAHPYVFGVSPLPV